MDRTAQVQAVLNETLLKVDDLENRRCGYVHLYAVAAFAAVLAMRRGLDPELCAVAGLLHDIATYTSGTAEQHAPRSAVQARALLQELGCFLPPELDVICGAISNHSDKAIIHDSYSEVLKDADVLQHSVYNTNAPIPAAREARIALICRELSLDWPGRRHVS